MQWDKGQMDELTLDEMISEIILKFIIVKQKLRMIVEQSSVEKNMMNKDRTVGIYWSLISAWTEDAE